MSYLSNGKISKTVLGILLIFFMIYVGYAIYSKMIIFMGTLGYDDAFHSLKALLIAEDLRNGSWLSVLYDSYRQVYYPPLHSLLMGITFLILPPNITSAGLFSLGTFLLMAIVIYFAALELDAANGYWIAIIVTLLLLTSPALVEYASRPMLEIPGLLALSLTLLVYFRLTKKPQSLKLNFLFGLGIVITYFMKSNYGVLLMIVTAVTFLIDARLRMKRLLTRQNFYLILPIIITFAIWFAYPPKLISTWSALVNGAYGVKDTFSLAGLLFYPKALVQISGSVWLFLIFLFCFFIAFKFFQDKKIRYLILLILIQMIIGEFHQTKLTRHIFPVLPAFFLIAGYVIVRWWNWQYLGNQMFDFWTPRLATVMILLYSFSLFSSSLTPVRPNVDKKLLDTVATLTEKDEPTLVVSTIEVRGVEAPALDWHLITDYQIMDASHSGIAMNLVWDEQAAAFTNRIGSVPFLQGLLLSVFTRADKKGNSRSLSLGQPLYAPYSQNQAELGSYLLSMRKRWTFNSVVVVTSMLSNAKYPIEFIDSPLKGLGFRILYTKEFSNINTQVDEYVLQP
jgi:hypothetical protein